MKTKAELKPILEETFLLLHEARQCYYDSYNLIYLDAEKWSLIRRKQFLVRAHINLWKMAVIETAKLFGGANEGFRLITLINVLINNYKDSEWKDTMQLNEIKDLKGLLESERVVSRVENLMELRSQHYAHKQKVPKNNKSDVFLYYEDIDELLKIGESICNVIYQKVFDCQRLVNSYDERGVKQLINDILELQKLKIIDSSKKISEY
jgi:hypothetical protein